MINDACCSVVCHCCGGFMRGSDDLFQNTAKQILISVYKDRGIE